MNWTAQINRIERNGITLKIVVSYFDQNGNEYDQELIVNNSQDPSWLQGQITNTLNQLADLDTFQRVVGVDSAINATLSIDPNTSVLSIAPISVGITPVGDIGENI